MAYYIINSQVFNGRKEVNSYFIVSDEDNFDVRQHSSYAGAAGPFQTKEEAEAWIDEHNHKIVELHCCSSGCTMEQWEYDMWNGRCAYEGQ